MSKYIAHRLHVDFIGLPTVLNDGESANTLHISITNNNVEDADGGTTDIEFKEENKVFIRFVVTPEQDNAKSFKRSWALCTQDQMAGAELKDLAEADSHFKIDKIPTPSTTGLFGWTLTPKGDFTLAAGDSIHLQIINLKTILSSGPSYGYCKIEQMPDEKEVVVNNEGKATIKTLTYERTFGPVLKGNAVLKGDNLGLGTVDPDVSLEVNGGVRAKGGAPGASGINNTGFFFGGGLKRNGVGSQGTKATGDNDSGMTSLGDGDLSFFANGILGMNMKQTGWSNSAEGNKKMTATVKGDLEVKGAEEAEEQGNLTVEGIATVKTKLEVEGESHITGIATVDGHIESSALYLKKSDQGKIGPSLNLFNTAGGSGSEVAINLSGYDTEAVNIPPSAQIKAVDTGSGSADIVFANKDTSGEYKNYSKKEPVERMRIKEDGAVDIKGKLTFDGKPAVLKLDFEYDKLGADKGMFPGIAYSIGIKHEEYHAFISGFHYDNIWLNKSAKTNSGGYLKKTNLNGIDDGNYYIHFGHSCENHSNDPGKVSCSVIAIHKNLF